MKTLITLISGIFLFPLVLNAQIKTEDLNEKTIDEIQSTENRPLTKNEQEQMVEKLKELEKIRQEHADYLKELEKEP